ncbi:hypothetical protein HN011_010871 [Eciton burchellii]|nr:hypothetical protein HN011_010871 [Eciton burchellii]
MESAESVSGFAERNEASEIRRQERRIRDGKIIVVVSSAEETKAAQAVDKSRRKIDDDDDVDLSNVGTLVHSLADGSSGPDGKENMGEKRIPGESRPSRRSNCETDKIFPQQQQRSQRAAANRSPRHESANGIPTLLCIDGRLVDAATSGVKPKIPRPANAFMLFANEWRRKLAAENPRESNKDISVRLVSLPKTSKRTSKPLSSSFSHSSFSPFIFVSPRCAVNMPQTRPLEESDLRRRRRREEIRFNELRSKE